jgi:hypothetical protein
MSSCIDSASTTLGGRSLEESYSLAQSRHLTISCFGNLPFRLDHRVPSHHTTLVDCASI